jgi:signal transduction histidine kinase
MRLRYVLLLLLSALCCSAATQEQALPCLISLEVDRRNVPVNMSEEGQLEPITLPSGYMILSYAQNTNDTASVRRFRYKLEGYDADWHEAHAEMRLVLRFYDGKGEWIAESPVYFSGQSPGWNGSTDTSPLVTRQQYFPIPERAEKFNVILSSAGAPNAVGSLAISSLKVSSLGVTPRTLLELGTLPKDEQVGLFTTPIGWERSGTRPSMAQAAACSQPPGGWMLAIFDDDVNNHAEWQSARQPLGSGAGKQLQVDWRHCHSIGRDATEAVVYNRLPPGRYLFRMNELSLQGHPTDKEMTLSLTVRPPLWQEPWFLILCGSLILALLLGSFRYVEWRRVQREIANLRQQQSLDQERMRIARDLHDEVGANLTHISIVGTIASRDGVAVSEMREKCREVAEVAQETIRACSEIVWSVNPLNDEVGSVIRHLTLYAQEYLQAAGIASVMETMQAEESVRMNPKARHELLMTFKEALQNVVKHSKATTVRLAFELINHAFRVRIADDGQGFVLQARSGAVPLSGNGIPNMTERIRGLGGSLALESAPGSGTVVSITLPVHEPSKDVPRQRRERKV